MATYTSAHTGAEIDLAVGNANLMLLTGAADPDITTVGTLGQLYQNTTDGTLFRCSAVGATYTWVELADYSPTTAVNTLTETAAGKVLDARQGKTLSDKIGTLASLSTTEKGSLVGAINENNALISTKVSMLPIATYTHTTNKEVVVSAVDVDTDTFTSVAHGLANGNVIYPVLNIGVADYLIKIVPGGLIGQTRYYVVNKTDDTFQVSTTSGGAAINLTANANLALTKFHFEKPSSISISNLGTLSKCKIKIKGRAVHTLGVSSNTVIANATGFLNNKYVRTYSGTIGQNDPYSNNSGDVGLYVDITIDVSGYSRQIFRGYGTTSTSASEITSTVIDLAYYCLEDIVGHTFDAITINTQILNGTVVEVYAI